MSDQTDLFKSEYEYYDRKGKSLSFVFNSRKEIVDIFRGSEQLKEHYAISGATEGRYLRH